MVTGTQISNGGAEVEPRKWTSTQDATHWTRNSSGWRTGPSAASLSPGSSSALRTEPNTGGVSARARERERETVVAFQGIYDIMIVCREKPLEL